MTTIHVHLAVGESALQQLLRRLKQGKAPDGTDLGASSQVQHILVSRLSDALVDAKYTIIYTTDREP